MRSITLLLLLWLVGTTTYGQSREKREADLRKANKIEETHVFLQDPEDSNKQRLYFVENYDSQGRIIARRTYNVLGRYQSYLQYDYPTDSTRVMLSLSNDGRVLNKVQKPYNLQDKPSLRPKFNSKKNLRFEYTPDGQVTEVWYVNPNWKDRLQAAYEYGPEGWLIKSTQIVPRKDAPHIYRIRTFERDKSGNILRKVTSTDDGTIESVETYTHTSFSTAVE